MEQELGVGASLSLSLSSLSLSLPSRLVAFDGFCPELLANEVEREPR